jgi:hypothetical protein
MSGLRSEKISGENRLVNNDFLKFPSTPHIAVLDGVVIRGDKVFTETEREEFLEHKLIIEEKVDGANLGISFDTSGNLKVQDRGSYLRPPYRGQWNKLSEWLFLKTDVLFEQLADRYILFGEWCYAQHSIFYDQLPEWFIGFDVFDTNSRRFLCIKKRNALLHNLNISRVPELNSGFFTFKGLKAQLSRSKFSSSSLAEGLYLRAEAGEWLEQRAKLVRPEFIQSIDIHWSRRDLKENKLNLEANN